MNTEQIKFRTSTCKWLWKEKTPNLDSTKEYEKEHATMELEILKGEEQMLKRDLVEVMGSGIM